MAAVLVIPLLLRLQLGGGSFHGYNIGLVLAFPIMTAGQGIRSLVPGAVMRIIAAQNKTVVRKRDRIHIAVNYFGVHFFKAGKLARPLILVGMLFPAGGLSPLGGFIGAVIYAVHQQDVAFSAFIPLNFPVLLNVGKLVGFFCLEVTVRGPAFGCRLNIS